MSRVVAIQKLRSERFTVGHTNEESVHATSNCFCVPKQQFTVVGCWKLGLTVPLRMIHRIKTRNPVIAPIYTAKYENIPEPTNVTTISTGIQCTPSHISMKPLQPRKSCDISLFLSLDKLTCIYQNKRPQQLGINLKYAVSTLLDMICLHVYHNHDQIHPSLEL